jgi:hypothetical protein
LSISEGFNNLTRIIYQSITYEKDWFYTSDQRSEPVTLSADKLYRLEAIFQQYIGNAYYSLAVSVPSSEFKYNSQKEIQQLTLKVPYIREIQRITIPLATAGNWTISYTM